MKKKSKKWTNHFVDDVWTCFWVDYEQNGEELLDLKLFSSFGVLGCLWCVFGFYETNIKRGKMVGFLIYIMIVHYLGNKWF
jgi:hypothetical protein